MTRPNHAQATPGTRRTRRRPKDGDPAWFRPYCRAQYAMIASIRLIGETRRTVARSRRSAHRRPVRASRDLHEASARLLDISTRLRRAGRELAETNASVADPAVMGCLLTQANERWEELAGWLQQAAADVFTLQEDVERRLQTGVLVPERPAERRPRIRLAPRPVPVRAFLHRRQPRVVDRIAPILRRRRRTPRPASVRVPRRSLLGRAPPLFPISVL